MSYHPIGGVASAWTHGQVDAYMRKWHAKGRSKKAIRNYLISEDVCQSPDFKRQCAERLDAAWRVATARPLPPMPKAAPEETLISEGDGIAGSYVRYAGIGLAALVALALILRRKR